MESTPKYFNNRTIRNKSNAFSLIEILLVVAIFGVVVFASLPLIRGIVYQNDLEAASLIVVSTLRQAENSARNGLNDSVWGVRINYPNMILFQGSDYASRVTSYDLNYTLNSNLTFSGLVEVTYSKMNAIPTTTPSSVKYITITNLNNNSMIININEKGRLSY
jgi:prepilin-type N-terminal cleavage/methylation domain-containing protein